MSDKKDARSHKSDRVSWLDEKTNNQKIHAYTERLSTFLEATADGKIDDDELEQQEARLLKLMKKVEPQLNDALHDDVTQLLCELTAYNIMHTVNDLAKARPKRDSKFEW